MERNQIISKVNGALAEEFELDAELLTPEAHIRDDLKLDSLDIVDMIMALEQAFDFKLEDRSKVMEILTLNDLYDFIEGLYKDRPAG